MADALRVQVIQRRHDLATGTGRRHVRVRHGLDQSSEERAVPQDYGRYAKGWLLLLLLPRAPEPTPTPTCHRMCAASRSLKRPTCLSSSLSVMAAGRQGGRVRMRIGPSEEKQQQAWKRGVHGAHSRGAVTSRCMQTMPLVRHASS